MTQPSRAIRGVATACALALIVILSEFLRGVPGEIALYPLLGAFPGLALGWALLPRASSTTRWVVGLVLAPLASSIAGWALLAAGIHAAAAARAIGWVAWALWAVQLARERAESSPRDAARARDVARAAATGSPGAPDANPDPGDRTPTSGAVWALSLGLSLAIAIPHFINPWMLVKSDAWNHCGIVYQILERGMPPEDPRFAGLHLNYVWFFNLFVGLLSSVHDGDPFVFMSTLNVADVALIAWLAYLAGWMLWRRCEGALGAALLTCFGFNAFMYLTWPLRGLRGMSGLPNGGGGPTWTLPALHLDSSRVLNDLGAPHSWIENFFDKFIVGTSINYAWLMMILFLWALVRLMRGRAGGVWLIAALAAAGMQLWHGVVGLSVVPVAACTLVLTLALRSGWRWLPPASRLLDFAAATAVGFFAVTGYTLSISRGWDAKQTGLHVSPLHLDPIVTITLVTSCALAAALAWKPMVSTLRGRRGDAAPLVAYAVGMYVFSLLIALPNQNEAKFAFEAFVPLALFGGPVFTAWAGRIRARAGAPGIVALAVLLAAPHVLTLVGFTLDRERNTYPALHPAPGETALYDRIRAQTPRGMVFVDDHYRDLIMVRARRQMYLGSASGPERAAFPLAQVIERRAVMADLYGPARDLDRDVASLAQLGRPACVVFRSQDVPAGARPGAALERRPDLFRRWYDHDGFVLYAVATPSSTSGAARP
ncbi:MAG: hypothetical protein HYR73_03920 [Candidatus Eisenbacteria bacterium]|nr:hypothetical protein [Candidatus Eisenbacteria bacterium]